MGGAPALPIVSWRGTDVSRDMVAPLDDLAASVTPLVTPIAGFGSYRDNAASGGTDNGSGHLDVYAGDGWTDADRKTFVANARERGFYCAFRLPTWWSPIRKKWITATWGRHFHLLLKDSADLSDGGHKQLTEWYAGSNGLAGFWWNGVWTHDPDDGPRTFLRQTWSQYLTKLAQEDDMAMTPADRQAFINDIRDAVLNAPVPNHDPNPNDNVTPPTAAFRSYSVMANWRAAQLQGGVAQLAGQVAGLSKAVAQLAAGQDVDLAAITAAAKAGAQAALDEKIAGADVTLNVTPSL